MPTPPAPRPVGPKTGGRPGDAWAAATAWADLLQADGGTFLGDRTERATGEPYQIWARPGQTDHTSATLNYRGSDVLKVFTDGWPGLTQDATYTKLGYLAATKFGGDHVAAARHLRSEGWGDDEGFDGMVHKDEPGRKVDPETGRDHLRRAVGMAYARSRAGGPIRP